MALECNMENPCVDTCPFCSLEQWQIEDSWDQERHDKYVFRAMKFERVNADAKALGYTGYSDYAKVTK